MSRLKIAVACQGGGSQTAFTVGALKTLCQGRIDSEFDVAGISSTSGGAVCATLLRPGMPAKPGEIIDRRNQLEGKIDRGPDSINRPIAEGEKAATRFLEERAAAVAGSPLGHGQTAGQQAGS